MALSEHTPAPLGFPDLSLSITYTDGLRYAQSRLQMIGRGELKPFCETHDLPYTTIVNLKNGKLKTEEPRLLQRVLRSLDTPTELLGHPPGSKTQRFLFSSEEALATFLHQLQSFTSTTSPTIGAVGLMKPS